MLLLIVAVSCLEGCEVCVTEGPQPVPYTFHYRVFLIYLNQIVIIVTIKKDNGSG